ncbi:MAG: glycosyltransferase [Zestosphaera sp.]
MYSRVCLWMKVVMINDCAFVGETLLKYMPETFVKVHVKRGRGLLEKSVGLTLKILSCSGDIYHVHYLLQDAFIAGLLNKKPLVCHAHGSDLRSSLHHPIWGKVVKADLRMCDYVIVSTPDTLQVARRFREDAQYVPNPVDFSVFYPKPMRRESEKKKVLIASDSNWDVKGTDIAIKALSMIKDYVDVYIISHGRDFNKTLALARKLGLQVWVLPKVPHEKMNQYYWSSDVVIDQFKLGSLGLVSLEGLACGRPVVTYVSSQYNEYREFPLKDLQTVEEIAEAVIKADEKLWEAEYAYLINNHHPQKIVDEILRIYDKTRTH